MPLKKQERKEEYSSVIGLMLQGKNKEAFDKLTCVCGKDTGLFIMADYEKEIAKLGGQWIDTTERLPTRFDSTHEDNSHIDCYIFINNQVLERPWNIHHECWDDRDYDDYEYPDTAPSHWMVKPDMPSKPII